MKRRLVFFMTVLISVTWITSCKKEKDLHLPAPKSVYFPSEKDGPLVGPFQVYKTEKRPTVEEKIPGLYFLSAKMDASRIWGQRAFLYFHVGKDEIVVFDTGQRGYGYHGEDIKNGIRRISDKPVGAIYLTHKHPDHIGNALSLQKALENHPPIYIGEPDYDFLYRIWKDFWRVPADYLDKNFKKLPINPDEKKVEDYNPVYAGSLKEGWEYYPACCHSAGNVVYFHKKLGVIIVGNWYQGCLERDKPIKSLMAKEEITTILFSHPNSIAQVCNDKEQPIDMKPYEATTDTKETPK
jgi:hypothetical protein